MHFVIHLAGGLDDVQLLLTVFLGDVVRKPKLRPDVSWYVAVPPLGTSLIQLGKDFLGDDDTVFEFG
jgi:hypothetical protein